MNVLRLFAFLLIPVALFPAHARAAESVVAVVNGDVITLHDLEQRTKLALLSSNLPDTPDMETRVQAAQLRRLVDEDLKIQAATKEKITVSAADITAQMDAIGQQNHMASGGLIKLLTSKGIETSTLVQQIRGDIAWARLVHQVLIRRVHVSEDAVSTRLDTIRANFGKPEYHAAEIYLSLEGAKDEAQVRDLAERLTEQMHQGAPFTAIAKQFNQAGAADGNLGWVSEGMLDDDLLAALSRLQPNEVTQPILTPDGYHILTLLEKRKVGEGIGGGAAYDMLQIDLNSLTSAGQAERDMQMKRLRETLAPAKSCDDLVAFSKQVPSALVNRVEKLPEAQLPTALVPLIKGLAPGQISEPIDTPKGRRFFAVCGRAAGDGNSLPSADDIRHQMEDEQLELVTRRFLIDLHRGNVIDIRLKDS
jgi:peptidyl-prolyl cis-trans isomerase SurA